MCRQAVVFEDTAGLAACLRALREDHEAQARPRRRLAAPFLRPSPCTQSGLEYAVRVRRWGYIHAFVLLRVAEGCVCPGATGEKQDGPFLRPLRIWGLS